MDLSNEMHRTPPSLLRDDRQSTPALPEAGATETSKTLVRRSRKLVDVIVHHDFERLREKIHQVDRVDFG